MIYNLYKADVLVNTIDASEEFVEKYCEDNKCTYEVIEDEKEEIEEEYTDTELLLELAADHEERICLLELGVM